MHTHAFNIDCLNYRKIQSSPFTASKHLSLSVYISMSNLEGKS